MYYLFNDDEYFNIELESTTLRKAIQEAKDRFRIIGKLRCIEHYSNLHTYKLSKSDYSFSLREVGE